MQRDPLVCVDDAIKYASCCYDYNRPAQCKKLECPGAKEIIRIISLVGYKLEPHSQLSKLT